MTTIAPASVQPLIKIVITESCTSTYFLTEEQLEDLNLPTTIAELSVLGTDELGVPLIDEAVAAEYAVTEREIEIASESD